jgi:hypothetical protein
MASLPSRDKEHSTIIYESPQPDTPLLRLGWNKQDPRYMATILMDSSKVVVLDIRCAQSGLWAHLDLLQMLCGR